MLFCQVELETLFEVNGNNNITDIYRNKSAEKIHYA